MSIEQSPRSFVEIDRQECRDQQDRVEELQQAFYHAARVLDAIAFDRIDHDLAMSVAYFTTQALESIADGQAEDASGFMIKLCRCLRDESDLFGPDGDWKGGSHADHA